MRYSVKEIKGLLDGYYELRESKGVTGHGLHLLCVLADLEQALKRLASKQRQALAMAMLGVPSREAGGALGVSHVTIQNRQEAAISWIVRYLNEGVE